MRWILLFACMGASGCSTSTFISNSGGVTPPTPATVVSYVDETRTAERITTGEYLIASISYSNEKCHAFFDQLEKFKQDESMIDKVLTALAASGQPLMVMAGASAQAATNVSTAVLFGNQINKITGEIYGFSNYKEQLKRHVFDAMADYQRQKGLDLLQLSRAGFFSVKDQVVKRTDPQGSNCSASDGIYSNDVVGVVNIGGVDKKVSLCRLNRFFGSREASDLMIARGIAIEYASYCSLAQMRAIVAGALDNTKTTVGPQRKDDAANPKKLTPEERAAAAGNPAGLTPLSSQTQ